MCRNIRVLSNFEPPASEQEIRDAASQFVRKVSGMRKPSKANTEVFDQAVDDIAHIVDHLLDALDVRGPKRNREQEKAKARAKWQKRAARSSSI